MTMHPAIRERLIEEAHSEVERAEAAIEYDPKRARRDALARISTLEQEKHRERHDAASNLNVAAVEMRQAVADAHTAAGPFIQAVERARVVRRVYESALARARKLDVETSPDALVPRVAADTSRPSHQVLGRRLQALMAPGVDW